MDGRDIGTTVFPDAELKLFMTADPMIRAQRRADEMKAKGEDVDIQEVLNNLQERDYIDSHRDVSPLTQAEDAIVLDNSHMNMEQQMTWLKDLISKRFGC
jgi:cytidylate kinase